ncbi:IclR family transcriptional regulator domain-containing protein [Leptothrix discophora]|uniref:IclR family transcriptional regulator C-terminal domain-containing protein n=1 Tax=Leptothrix discophora TaxID=89 RepID=A0ABT9FYL6_LEPDI|nr:IclR family transcriptional regulator C-terminal domain-containing protein [Leptothrix discophora]MDP4299319.1 IclR family transcriptional regulator C-terminal domain-containing protein [Leptothrix discophora]
MTQNRPPVDRSLLIEGLGKGLRVIEAFSDDWPRMTATECGERTGLTRTAARRYLMTLVHDGYADTDGKHYWLMPSVLRLGQSYLEAARLPRLVQPFLQRLSMHTGETANFSVLDGHDVVYLVRSNSPRVVSIGFQVGARMPAHAVSPGTAVLSTWSPEALEAWLATHDYLKFNAATVGDADRLRERVERARQQGYIRLEQQVDVGLGGLAVPLVDRKGRCVGALSITFQAQAYPEETCLQRLLPPLQEASQALRPIV